MNELQNLSNSILNEDEIPNDNYEKIINENQIGMEFFLGIINSKGFYQSRLLQIFIAMMFIIGIQFNQIVYLFISPQFKCERSQSQDNNNLFSKNTHLSLSLTQAKHIIPAHTDCIMADYGQCNHTNIIKDSLYLNSPVSMFGLYCRKRPFRSVLKIMVILASMMGGLVASCIASRRKKLSVLLMFGIMAVCICTNSAAYYSTPQSRYETQQDWFGNGEIPFQQQWSPIDPLNLIDFHSFTRYMIADNSIWFVIFYMGASFGGFGCLITMQSYMQDFYSVEQRKENRHYLILAFSSSQLLASFLKLFILDWRVFSLFIGIPSILIMITLSLYIHDNPLQLIDNLVKYSPKYPPHNITNISLEQIKQHQPDNKSINLEEKIYNNFMRISLTNQRRFLSRWQFQVALDRLIQCHNKGEQDLNFAFSMGLICILTTLSMLYMTPFFMINEYGSGIIFNLSMLSISEILSLFLGRLILDYVNLRESIKYNLLLCAIVGFIIAFADFRDVCNNQAEICQNMVQKQ